MTEVMVDSELWKEYSLYAESKGKTAREWMNMQIKLTVEVNRERIQKYREGLEELRRSLDAEDGLVSCEKGGKQK